ncbi:MAG: VWA domain-containing protein [Chloroflexota bacterium]
MTWGQINFLWLLAVIPVAVLCLYITYRQRQRALNRLGNLTLITRLSESVNWTGRRWQTWLWVMALLLIVIALARPQLGSELQIVEQEGLQIMVVLDVSRSMLAEDLRPNRLARAKLEISELMDRLGGDEIGLVLFSGASFIQFPLTSDYDTARAFLGGADPSVISRPGTLIGDAIRTAMSGFDIQYSSQKVIVIMTDGENHEDDALQAAQEAADEGAIIYAIGFGSPQGEPIPTYDGTGQLTGYIKDENDNIVLSKLDEVTLQRIALATDGRYFRAQSDGRELDALVATLDGLEKEMLETRFEPQKIERFQIFVALAILALIVAALIPPRVLGQQKQESKLQERESQTNKQASKSFASTSTLVLVLSLVLLSSCSFVNRTETTTEQIDGGENVVCRALCAIEPMVGSTLREGASCQPCAESASRFVVEGNAAFESTSYNEAGQAYAMAQDVAPDRPEPIYNLANTLYRQEAYTDTQQLMVGAINAALATNDEVSEQEAGQNLTASGYFNLGNAYFQQQQWNEAVDAYRHALRQQPDDQEAKYNLELAMQQLQSEQSQGQDQQQDQQQDQSDENPESSEQQQSQDQNQQQNQSSEQEQQSQGDEQQGEQEEQESSGGDGEASEEQESEQQAGSEDAEQQSQESQQAQAGSEQPVEGLTEEQALQLLRAIGQNTQTLQERLQQNMDESVPSSAPEKDW